MTDDRTKPITRTFHFKVATFKVDGRATLQTKLRKAYSEVPKAMSRRQETVIDGEVAHRLINHLKEVGLLTCGALMAYREGVVQNTIMLDDEAEELLIETIAPPTSDAAKRSEFLQGLLYFGVYKNNVVFMGTTHVLSSHFESHLNWLLKDLTNTSAKAESLLITDPLSRELSRRNYSKVKSLKIKSSIKVEEDEESAEISSRKLRPAGATWNAIVNLVSNAFSAEVPNVDFQSGLRSDDLEVTVNVRLKTVRGRINLNTPVLDPLANAFRHIPDPPIELEFTDGFRLKGDQLKVSHRMGVNSREGIPFEDDVYSKMNTWLLNLLTNESVNRS